MPRPSLIFCLYFVVCFLSFQPFLIHVAALLALTVVSVSGGRTRVTASFAHVRPGSVENAVKVVSHLLRCTTFE